MIRKLLAAASVAAVLLVAAPPAQAAQQPGTPTPTAPHPRTAQAAAPLCVTTTWRAKHTHRPKTRPGQICRIDDGMWLPDSWRILDVVVVAGEPYLLVQRPAIVRHRSVRAL